MTREQVEEARRIILQERRFIPSDVLNLLKQIVQDADEIEQQAATTNKSMQELEQAIDALQELVSGLIQDKQVREMWAAAQGLRR